MATWQPTKGDARRLRRDMIPGRPYYTVSGCLGGQKRYMEWRFTGDQLVGFTSGHMSPAHVMAVYGPITDEQPKGIERI